MKSKFVQRCVTAVLAVGIAATGLCSCNNQDENKIDESNNLLASVQKSDDAPNYDFNNAVEKPEGYGNYIVKMSGFALNLLKQEDYTAENTAVSPAAVALALSALENAANKDTQKEVKSYFGKTTQTTEEINLSAAYLTQRMSFFNNETTGIFNVNSLWISDKLSVKRSFLQKIENYYSMFAYKTDFADKTVNSLITNFIADKSYSLINSESINTGSDYQIYIDSSMVVSDNWLKSYGKNDVKLGEFTNADKSISEVNFLTSAERTFTAENAQGFIKDVENATCKLICIIPNEGISLEKYLEELTAEQFLDMPSSASPTEFTNVSIPKFTVERNGSIKESLQNMGLNSIFQNDADFSKGFSENVYVNDITQTVSIVVDENGLCVKGDNAEEAATQSADGELIFNRPFIYAVVDNESYAPIIIGTVNNL